MTRTSKKDQCANAGTSDAFVGEKTILAVDVANDLTRFGLFAGDVLEGVWEASTPGRLTTDEARQQARFVIDELCPGCVPDGAILSCVVPSHTDTWASALTDVAASRALVVGPRLRCGVRMRQDDPAGVGADRVANVAAAKELTGAPAIVVSLGETTNLEVVDEDGAFAGGIITPGLMLGVRALADAAARLPMVEPHLPHAVIGRNTREAMQSGAVYGEVARIDGLLDMAMEELGYPASIVLAGRYAKVISPLLGREHSVDEVLTLRGLALIWHANRG